MECPSINRVTFSKKSTESIDEVRRVNRSGAHLQLALGGGTLLNIFAGNGSLQSSYMIMNTDFKAMSEALAAVPNLVKRRINYIAHDAYEEVKSHEEKQFWMAVAQGCDIK